MRTYKKICIGLMLICAGNIAKTYAADKEISLSDAIVYGLKNSYEVRLAKLDYLMQETDIEISESIFDAFLEGSFSYSEDNRQPTSVVYPSQSISTKYNAQVNKKLPTGTDVSLGYSHQRGWNNSAFASVNPANDDQLFVEARQPMMKNILGYLDRRRVTMTKLAVENASLDEKESFENIIAEVEKAYWQAAARQETVVIYEDMVKKARELFDINEKNYDVGRIEKADLIASEANVYGRENDLEREKVLLKNALAVLKKVINFDDSVDMSVSDKLQDRIPEVTFEQCLKIALQNRRDYKKAKRDVQINNVALQMTGNERWPEVDVVGTLAMNGINSNLSSILDMAGDNENTYYYVGVEIKVPVENSEAVGKHKKAKFSKERSVVSLKNIERSIVTDVGNAHRDYILYDTLLEKLIEVSKLQKQKLEEETKQFDYGRSSTKKIIDYQREYLLARIDVVLGMYNYEQSRVDLEKELNILLRKYEEVL